MSRQQEEEYHRHYGYQYYAESWPLWGLAGYPVMVPPPSATETKQRGVDSHLRSARDVAGYKVEVSDGVVGEVTDFMVDGRTWVIREIVIDCGRWYSGKKIIVPTGKVSRISYKECAFYVDSAESALMEAAEATV